MEAPRDNLTRSVPFSLTRQTDDGDGLTLEGYAAVFNETTSIDSWEGEFDEQIAPGAFRKTLKERTPVLQFDHGSHPMVGQIPIGAVDEIREDRRGLFVRGVLHDNWLIQPVRDAIASGSIAGMSFRFGVVKDEWDHDAEPPLRTLHEVRLHEVSPVVWPAYEATTVGVRSKVREVLDDPEARAELARALVLGTPDSQPDSTGEGAATPDEPPEGTRLSTDRLHHLSRIAGAIHDE